MFAACNQSAGKKDTGEYSEEFLKIQHKAEDKFGHNAIKAGHDYLDSAFSKLKHPTVNDRFRYYALKYVYFQKTLRDFDSAMLYADSMLALANKSVNPKQYSMNYAEANFARGDSFFELKQFNDAYQAYYQGYLTGKNYLNLAALCDYTYRMGMIMYKKGHYKLAANYFKDSYHQISEEARTFDRGFPGFYRRQELLDNIAISYKHNNEADSAIKYFDIALKFINDNAPLFPDRKRDMDMARGVVYGNKAEIYMQTKQFNNAIDLLKKSIAINMQPGFDNRDAELSEIKLGQIYLDIHASDSLINLLGNIRKQLDTVANADAEADYNRLLGNLYVQRNDLKLAINHIQRYNLMKDSIIKRSALLMESDVNQQLANYEKQHEIDKLSNSSKLQTIYLYVSIFFALMAVIIVFLVYRNFKRSRQEVKTINVLNKQINEQNYNLEKALKEINTSSQEKDRILRAVAHDLRNPIGGIASLTTIMAEEDYSEEQKEMINLVKETSFNSLELINEILEATNLNSVELHPEPTEINGLLSNSVELLKFKAAEKGQEIILEPLDKQIELVISREKIWRVVSNLITNAIKFSPTGGTIQVKAFEFEDHKIVIAVKDNGIGIPDKMKDQIFNMFTSAQRPGTAGEKSFGLGLSICRQIMEKHHGKIWFESDVDKGTTFFISLPLILAGVHGGSNTAQKFSEPTA
ncbi:sensor histidine kinase [Mucilaginibacter conchicola]|uniref:histidine kinase n=2 Tax=Mucilaginibacter conchicola TaxID=2303333 RepID=A0A372NWL7_9SPHI|nr:sensor histidine kinase [Mucilaginibacter conchicola]